MGELTRDIIDNQFDKTQVASYDLSILLGVDRFFYAVKNQHQSLVKLSEVVYPELFGEQNYSLINSEVGAVFASDFFRLRFKSIRVILRNDRFTLLPQRLYKEGQEALYLEKSTNLNSSDKLVVEELVGTEMLNIFAVEESTWNTLKGHFPVSKISHSATPLILSFQKYLASKNEKRVLLEIGLDSFQIVFLDGSELLFANSFNYSSPEDFIYYVMMVFEQFRLKPENCPVFLAGIVEKDSDLYKILFRYIRHIQFVAFPSNLVLDKMLDTNKNHHYFNLFGLW